MLVSRLWLQKFFDTELPPAEKLSEALTFHAFEIDGMEKVGNDDVLDVKVTPNRGHDCLSHRGIAKELSAILQIPFIHDPLAKARLNLAGKTDKVAVTVEDSALCPRYLAGYITGVKVGPSPEWLRERLEAVGQRSINNIVDATNFVMFNMGQPLHAFDASKLHRGLPSRGSPEGSPRYHIVVRKARTGEKILTLDDKEYSLTDSMLVIADGNTETVIGIAGVKGGKPAGISEETTNIIIESANFDGTSVRKTAQALALRTDASARFEQGLSPWFSGYGMHFVVELIQRLAGGELQDIADVYPKPQKPRHSSVSVKKINQVLGTALTGADVADAFTRLGFEHKPARLDDAGRTGGEEEGVFEVVVPFERMDIEIAEDLVEEVGRIIGYDKIPAVPLPPLGQVPEVNKNFYTAKRVRDELAAAGYSEVYTSVFADRGERMVLNKVDSVRPYLRTTLTDGLADALNKNIPNKDMLGLTEVKLFEIGTVWKDGKEITMVGSASEKHPAVEKPLDEYVDGGEPAQYEDLPTSSAVLYRPFSKYPYIVRDVAMWVSNDTDPADVLWLLKKVAGELCVKTYLFDRFEKPARPDDSGRSVGEEKVSLAFRLIFQSFEKTLTEAGANEAMAKVHTALQTKGFDIR